LQVSRESFDVVRSGQVSLYQYSVSLEVAHRTKHNGKKCVCEYCLLSFIEEHNLKKHHHICCI